jgi:hypothetical protein
MGDSWVIVRRETGENLNESFSGTKKDFYENNLHISEKSRIFAR